MHPNLSKEKLYPFVKVFCGIKKLSCPKPRTIGPMIADQPDKMRSRPIKLGSKEFFGIVAEVFPYPLQSVLTDNGSGS